MGLSEKRCTSSAFVDDDGGFTQLGVVIAVLLTVSLLLTSAQAYWVQSNSADIQSAADLGALSAENVVAEYMVIARLADGIVLSMSLTGLALYGASAVCALIPGAQVAAPKIAESAKQVLESRDSFARSASTTLDELQKALPFLCAVEAAIVIEENGRASSIGASYLGIAIPVPLTGESTELPDDGEVDEAGGEIAENNAEAEAFSEEAQEAEEEMNAAKLAGYEADCADGGSQRERAARLAGLSGARNPNCSSVDLWGFQMAIDRAKAYYAARQNNEGPASNNPEEISRSVARSRFYAYAYKTVSQGYVSTDARGVTTAHMPFLPKNTEEVRATELYTESVYPVSSDGVLHASMSCPACGGISGYAALCDIDSGRVSECPTCQYTIRTVGRTPAASTSIDNGFEYYYRAVATAAASYSEASERYADASEEAKRVTDESVDEFSSALESFKTRRYDPKPPGRYGCIAVVVDPSSHAGPLAVGSLSGDVQIGPRIAVAAAALAPESATRGTNVISSLLSGLSDEAAGSGAGWVAEKTVELWGSMLAAYGEGTEAFLDGVENLLDAVPGLSEIGLASWARDMLEDEIELLGLEPVKLDLLRPALINTSHVLEHADGNVSGLLGDVRSGYNVLNSNELTLSFSLVPGLPDIELTIDLSGLADRGDLPADTIASALAAGLSGEGGARRWE